MEVVYKLCSNKVDVVSDVAVLFYCFVKILYCFRMFISMT